MIRSFKAIGIRIYHVLDTHDTFVLDTHTRLVMSSLAVCKSRETRVMRQRQELWDRDQSCETRIRELWDTESCEDRWVVRHEDRWVVRHKSGETRDKSCETETWDQRVIKWRESWVTLARVIGRGLWGLDDKGYGCWLYTGCAQARTHEYSRWIGIMRTDSRNLIYESWQILLWPSTHESCDKSDEYAWWVCISRVTSHDEYSWWVVTGLVSTHESCDKTQYSSWLLIRIVVIMSSESCHVTHEHSSWVLMTLARVLQKRVQIHESEAMSQTCLLSATTRAHTQMYAPSSTHVNVHAQPAHTHTSMQTHTHAHARTPGEAVSISNLWPRERWCCF